MTPRQGTTATYLPTKIWSCLCITRHYHQHQTDHSEGKLGKDNYINNHTSITRNSRWWNAWLIDIGCGMDACSIYIYGKGGMGAGQTGVGWAAHMSPSPSFPFIYPYANMHTCIMDYTDTNSLCVYVGMWEERQTRSQVYIILPTRFIALSTYLPTYLHTYIHTYIPIMTQLLLSIYLDQGSILVHEKRSKTLMDP